jgi:CheY-like chemotaxis protein
MPVLDGYQAYEQIKTFRPDLPVIAQTAYASSDDEKKIKQMGFKGYISKPINKEKLFEIINQVMQSKYNV